MFYDNVITLLEILALYFFLFNYPNEITCSARYIAVTQRLTHPLMPAIFSLFKISCARSSCNESMIWWMIHHPSTHVSRRMEAFGIKMYQYIISDIVFALYSGRMESGSNYRWKIMNSIIPVLIIIHTIHELLIVIWLNIIFTWAQV